jgi:biotin synthase
LGLLAYSNEFVTELHYHPSAADLAADGAGHSALLDRAAGITRATFGRSVFVRAVVEISNFCREQCAYCGMRRDNRALARYRAQADQLIELVLAHRPECVTDINIQAGEDPVAVRDVAIPLVRAIREHTALGVSVCLGTLNAELYHELQRAGASIYIMKFECANPEQYVRFQAPGTLTERLAHIRLLAESGWTVSSGFIAGLPGQMPADLLRNLELAASLPLRGCSVSPFIPGEATPLATAPRANPNWTLNCMAALRLRHPQWVIPAVSALNLAEKDGYRHGLRAGANLATINLTPEEVRENYVIYQRERFIMTTERVLNAIAAEGLVPSRLGLVEHYQRSGAAPSASPSHPRSPAGLTPLRA